MTRLLHIGITTLLLLFSVAGFSFELSVAVTNETCPGNGALNFTVSNPNPSGSITFIVYKLPDITTPYSSGPEATVSGLAAGDYRVIARETVGATITNQQQDVTISSSFVPLTYTVQAQNQACSTTSSIAVNVNTGTAATYSIIEGPVTFPAQASNTFSGLPVGIYKVRVIDSCGNAVVQTFTVTLNPTNLTIGAAVFTDTTPPSCTQVVASNTITAATGTVIGYPLSIQYSLHSPSGTNNIQTTLSSGDPSSQAISLTIPYQVNQTYTYDITITDACGTTYPTRTFLVNNNITLASTVHDALCNNHFFSINVAHFVGSYTLQFTNMPVGFNPAAFNSSYPGPFSQDEATFGSDTQPVPFGDYSATVTDPCGKAATISFSVLDEPPVPTVIGTNNGCLTNSGTIDARIPNYKIVSAIIVGGPTSYPFPIPHDVSASIDSNGVLILTPVPLGDYILNLIDDCGNVLNQIPVTVPAYVNQGITIDVAQGCDLGKASVKITGNNSPLTSVKITAAPAGSGFALPLDISNNISSDGVLYMAGLPSGTYTFNTIDSCGFTTTESKLVEGYAVTTSSYSLTANCGSFDIPLHFVDNSATGGSFALQKLLDPAANTWGHPATGAVYTEGTVPNSTNSYLLQNNATNLNLTFNGTFRIVHTFTSYNNGSDINAHTVTDPIKNCIDILSPTLTFNNALAINDVVRVPCSSSGNLDVMVMTNGTPPLRYRITEKDGVAFLVNNGNSNVFLNLQPGIYKFEVEDGCGNTINRTFDVSDLASLVTINPVCDLFSCAAIITGNETFDLTAQTPIILGDQLPADYTLSYHTTQANADNNTNPITNLAAFNPATNPATVYVRLAFNQLPNCAQTASFQLLVGQTPRVNLRADYVVCDSQPITLDASAGNLPTTTYLWSNGATTPTVTVSEVGATTLTVTATNNYGSCNGIPFECEASKDITVTIAAIPEIKDIETHDWTDNENSITVITTTTGAFEYSLDGITFQESNVFDHLKPGLYTVFVRDVSGCKTVTAEIWLLNYPKFFTPNGDGYNDTWYVKNSDNEPDFYVDIFDRYGKLLTRIQSNGFGWDGKYNNKVLFADDYWFVAYRQDGRTLRGHFALKR